MLFTKLRCPHGVAYDISKLKNIFRSLRFSINIINCITPTTKCFFSKRVSHIILEVRSPYQQLPTSNHERIHAFGKVLCTIPSSVFSDKEIMEHFQSKKLSLYSKFTIIASMLVLFSRREILALQAENYALEKQLYSYQQSIAKTNSKDKPEQENAENYISKGRRY